MDNKKSTLKYQTKAYVIVFSVLLAVLVGVWFFMPSENVTVQVENDTITFSCSKTQFGKRTVLASNALDTSLVSRLELVDGFDAGALINGVRSEDCLAGAWENSNGEYSLYAYADTPRYIILWSEDEALYVFNFESAEATESFYEALLSHIGI